MDQTPAAGQTAAAAPPQPADSPAEQPVDAALPPAPPGFGARGRVRRRARFLRKARELAYRDLGGLVFSLHRYGQRNDSLVLAKLATLSRIDAELRALEASLSERQPVTVLREAGVTACPRCAAIHSGEDRFCPNCGLPLSRRSDLPIAGAPPASVPAGLPAPGAIAQGSPVAMPAPAAAAPIAAAPAAPPTASPAPPPAHAPGAAPARAPASPATQVHASVDPRNDSAGRSPTPPATAADPPAQASDDDQPTEIVHPRPSGS